MYGHRLRANFVKFGGGNEELNVLKRRSFEQLFLVKIEKEDE